MNRQKVSFYWREETSATTIKWYAITSAKSVSTQNSPLIGIILIGDVCYTFSMQRGANVRVDLSVFLSTASREYPVILRGKMLVLVGAAVCPMQRSI